MCHRCHTSRLFSGRCVAALARKSSAIAADPFEGLARGIGVEEFLQAARRGRARVRFRHASCAFPMRPTARTAVIRQDVLQPSATSGGVQRYSSTNDQGPPPIDISFRHVTSVALVSCHTRRSRTGRLPTRAATLFHGPARVLRHSTPIPQRPRLALGARNRNRNAVIGEEVDIGRSWRQRSGARTAWTSGVPQSGPVHHKG